VNGGAWLTVDGAKARRAGMPADWLRLVPGRGRSRRQLRAGDQHASGPPPDWHAPGAAGAGRVSAAGGRLVRADLHTVDCLRIRAC
jgi:hypothetical protein